MNSKPTYKELEEELAFLKTTNKLIEKSSIVRFVWKNQENWPVEYVSENVKNIFGYSADDFITNKIVYSEIIFPDDLTRVKNELHSQSKTGFYSIEHEPYRIKSKSGRIKWLNDITLIRRNKSNEITHLEGIIIDITEQKESEQALIESELRWKFAIEGNADGLWDWNLITNEVFFSAQWKKMLGFSENEISGSLKEWDKRVHPDDKEKAYQDINNHISGKTDFYQNEHRLLCKNNTYKWILDRGKIISYTSDNKPERMIGTLSDISDRKQTEQALKESETKLIESNKSKDKFFSIIAHDLKSPFNSMLGFSEILNKNFDKYNTEKKKRFIWIINEGLQNTLKLLDNLLHWSQSQKGIINFNPEEINLYLTVKEISDLLNQSAENKSIKLINQLALNIYVDADKDMLSTIIRNLLSNAIKYTHRYGEITIKTFLVPDENNIQYLGISVSDTGVGIPKEIQSKLFDISENTSMQGTENEKGTGLGLILCKEFVEKHGGKIWLESEIDKGSTFYFTIPIK